jgi:hypothetical protein
VKVELSQVRALLEKYLNFPSSFRLGAPIQLLETVVVAETDAPSTVDPTDRSTKSGR